MSGAELLEHVDDLARTLRETEAKILLAARQHAILNDAQTIDPWQARIPGGERARRLGGEGTPLVAEFSPATLAARLGLSSYAGRELVADALDLSIRLPRLWERVQALEVRAHYARFVARKTRDLTGEQADLRRREGGRVGRRPHPLGAVRDSWWRRRSRPPIPVAAAEAEEAAHRRQFADPTRSDEHGMRGFYIRGPFATIARFDATVAFIADLLRTTGRRRSGGRTPGEGRADPVQPGRSARADAERGGRR